MNPFRAVRFGKRAAKAWDTLDEAAKTPTLYQSAGWWTRALDACADALELAPVPEPLRRLRQMKNWKTTMAGLAAILSIVAKIAKTGVVDWQTDPPAIIAGVGLITASDAGATK